MRGPYRELEEKYLQRFRGFNSAHLLRSLGELGILDGSVLCVHSGMSEFSGFRDRAINIIRTFQQAVGHTGTLLMVTIPFAGNAVAYARRDPIFEVKRTPSQMGMISEFFRRFPKVERSMNPTHPIAVWANDANGWITLTQ